MLRIERKGKRNVNKHNTMRKFIFIQGLSLRVIILFGVAILGTFLSDYLTEIQWFGDTVSVVTNSDHIMKMFDEPRHQEILHYSARHYWYNWGFAVLFLLQLISFIWYTVNKINTRYL